MSRGRGAVTDEQIDALRAYLTGDREAYDGFRSGSNPVDAQRGYAFLFAAAFFEAANRRFAPAWNVLDVVRFVAGVRSRYLEDPEELHPGRAEWLLRSALGDRSLAAGLDDETRAAQVVLLPALLGEQVQQPEQLDEFLQEARIRAETMAGVAAQGSSSV
jgi:hypothetical protein